jgi:hypothetical protein
MEDKGEAEGIPGPSQYLETVGVMSLKRVVTVRMSWNISAGRILN